MGLVSLPYQRRYCTIAPSLTPNAFDGPMLGGYILQHYKEIVCRPKFGFYPHCLFSSRRFQWSLVSPSKCSMVSRPAAVLISSAISPTALSHVTPWISICPRSARGEEIGRAHV